MRTRWPERTQCDRAQAFHACCEHCGEFSCFDQQRLNALARREAASFDQPKPVQRLAYLLQRDRILCCKVPARVRSFCLLEIATHRRRSRRQLPRDLAVNTRFLSQFAAEYDDGAGEFEDARAQIGRMRCGHGCAQRKNRTTRGPRSASSSNSQSSVLSFSEF
jgi:hypothetical protein